MTSRNKTYVAGLFGAALAFASPLQAQQISDTPTGDGAALIEALTAAIGETNQATRTRTASIPGIPSAINASHGTVFGSVSYSNPRGGVKGAGGDGAASIGVAVGDAADGISLQFTLVNASIKGFGDDGYATIQLSKQLTGFTNPTYVGLTASNLAGWGSAKTNDESLSLQFTQTVQAGSMPLLYTVGYGSEVRTDKAQGDREGAFAGFGLGVADGWSVGASTNFDKVNIGASYDVPSVEGLSVSFSATDIAGKRGEPVFTLSVGYSFNAF